jgi:uncharacterized membrane protein YraQ (UPF0718 family)
MFDLLLNPVCGWLLATWGVFALSAPYLLFGFFLAGIIHVFVSPAKINRFLGQGKYRSVFNAAIIGIPIPLCSCGVLPTALSLKKQGANTGATTAFLISTPESGVDSILLTYGLMGSLMAIARPIAGFIIAFCAGALENFFAAHFTPKETLSAKKVIGDCCKNASHPTQTDSGVAIAPHSRKTLWQNLKEGLSYAYIDLLGDIAKWFLVGIGLAGLISHFIPAESVSQYLSGGLSSMLLMLMVGIPLYICASASTPIAAALVLKGMSPGAALVFLIAGPATNIASVVVLAKELGVRATAIYLLSSIVFSLVLGSALNSIYRLLGISLKELISPAQADHDHTGVTRVEFIAAMVLIILFVHVFWRKARSAKRMEQSA